MTKQLFDGEKPYDRFLKAGPEALTDTELLAIIIRTGHKGADAMALARKVLEKAGDYGITGLYHMTVDELMQIKGIGQVKAVKIKCIAELSNRIARAKRGEKVIFHSPAETAKYYMEQMRHLEKEQCLCVFLDGAMGLIRDQTISVGTVNASLFSGRDIFMEALSAKAVNFMILHNHPSGNVNPSRADVQMTQKLIEASRFMDIPLIDHIIIGDNCYYSFREHDMIQ
ncbi:MAG: DNA repair protein RadC [Lachnospiraceae bacterium]|nr:DNA repair protein RadC [Lachnospiraceae bacterium]